ncbi:MAG: glutaminyl-peptide cyclotransferase [Actinobacteria bacterium]|nr:glutaminyl-peptide cyclotransferase [Actinomycetota bacterium]
MSLFVLTLSTDAVRRYPHDTTCYTQGLEFINNETLVQSCGMYGQSKIQLLQIDPNKKATTTIKEVAIDRMVFGEGITRFAGHIYQLTWKENKVFVYNDDLTLVRTIRWPKAGWGLAHNETCMFVSDGSSTVYVVDKDFKEQSKISVRDGDTPVTYINELEYCNGYLLANIYYQSKIIVIDLHSGLVVTKYDAQDIMLDEMKSHHLQEDEVLNGIAYDPTSDRLLITGKRWSQIYEIPTNRLGVPKD